MSLSELENKLQQENKEAERLKQANKNTEQANIDRKTKFAADAPEHWEKVILPTVKGLIEVFNKNNRPSIEGGTIVTHDGLPARQTNFTVQKGNNHMQVSILQNRDSASFEICTYYKDGNPRTGKGLITSMTYQRGYTLEQLNKETIEKEVSTGYEKLIAIK